MALKIFSIIAFASLSSCGIKRPDVRIGNINAPGGYFRSYNMRDDYDDSGKRKADARPQHYKINSINDLNKWLCFTSDEGPEEAQSRLIAYIRKLREEYEKGCSK